MSADDYKRCPRCNSGHTQPYCTRTTGEGGSGLRTQYRQCLVCEHTYRVRWIMQLLREGESEAGSQ